ncbi:SDR family NAD(P)-dependent oxidoreductase [Nocardioides sp. HM23]|uniref:SDR family NAD(P)-dependent oxidoreductase n=1 Tax=Nocardioides bizhenqiangii TaxID=3095076 RepID=UPI002ACA4298|nr:SDR family NAD(P)-dependent oxidoreductase [Nocardioides sp. HM23]MDZ5619442.1 SDR family NAD(P)-dependent oxidoreductase [Nocardioides sp. HM23]
MDRFAGKVVLVTGASSGLGAACAQLFAAQGARVLAVARDETRLAKVAADATGEVTTHVADLADPDACGDAVSACVRELGRLDVVVNNAGRHDFRITTEVTQQQWSRDLAVNLDSVFFTSQAALPHLLQSRGNIVNVASVAGVLGEAYSAAYTAAKHGVVGMTKALAVEYARSPVRINCVCPGGMDTPQAHTIEVPEGADWELIMRVAALRGFMSAEQVAQVVAFVASDEASAMHGSILAVDQGHTAG